MVVCTCTLRPWFKYSRVPDDQRTVLNWITWRRRHIETTSTHFLGKMFINLLFWWVNCGLRQMNVTVVPSYPLIDRTSARVQCVFSLVGVRQYGTSRSVNLVQFPCGFYCIMSLYHSYLFLTICRSHFVAEVVFYLCTMSTISLNVSSAIVKHW